MAPKGYNEKKIKSLYLGPYAFLSKNKGTFIRQTFHFLSESIFLFFIFAKKRPKIAVLVKLLESGSDLSQTSRARLFLARLDT